MSPMSNRITLDELTADEALLGPWYSGDPPAADACVAHPKGAAAHALLTALNADEGAKGIIRILAKSAEDKRLIRCYLDAMLDQPKLKAMVKRSQPEQISLHGGLRIVIDLNEARLTKDVVATIALDASVGGWVAYHFLEPWRRPGGPAYRDCTQADFDREIELVLDDMVASGEIKPDQRHRVFFVRWALPSKGRPKEQPSVFDHPLTKPEAGPPSEPAPDPDQLLEQKLKRRQAKPRPRAYTKAVEARRREEANEKIADHFARIKQRGV